MHPIVKPVLWIIAALLLLRPLPLSASPHDNALIFGVCPYLSASQMVAQLSPLVKRIEEALGRKVVMISAPDFISFVDRTTKGDYDLVLTAPHMGRLAQVQDGWQPVVESGQTLAAVVLVRMESPIRNITDLRGKTIAIGNRHSVTYLLTEKTLLEKGLKVDKDVEVIDCSTFSNVAQSVFLSEVDAGATPVLLWDAWQYINAEQHDQLRELFRTNPAAPNFFMMASPKTDPATIRRLIDSLSSYQDSPEGRDFFQKSQFISFLPVDQSAMKEVDPFLRVLRGPR